MNRFDRPVEGSFEEATKKVAGPFDNPEDGLEQLKDDVLG